MKIPRRKGALNLETFRSSIFIPVNGYSAHWNHPILSRDSELRLIKRAQKGGGDSLKQVMMCNLRLVIKVALLYSKRYDNFMDLVQAGFVGLHKSIMRFDTTSGNRLMSYAIWYIRREIQDAVGDSSDVSMSISMSKESLAKMDDARSLVRRFGMDTPSVGLLSEVTGLEIADLDRLLNGITEMDRMSLFNKPDGSYERDTENLEFYDSLENLSELERGVLTASFGLGGSIKVPDDEQCQFLGVGMETLKGIRDNALRNFRKYYSVE